MRLTEGQIRSIARSVIRESDNLLTGSGMVMLSIDQIISDMVRRIPPALINRLATPALTFNQTSVNTLESVDLLSDVISSDRSLEPLRNLIVQSFQIPDIEAVLDNDILALKVAEFIESSYFNPRDEVDFLRSPTTLIRNIASTVRVLAAHSKRRRKVIDI